MADADRRSAKSNKIIHQINIRVSKRHMSEHGYRRFRLTGSPSETRRKLALKWKDWPDAGHRTGHVAPFVRFHVAAKFTSWSNVSDGVANPVTPREKSKTLKIPQSFHSFGVTIYLFNP